MCFNLKQTPYLHLIAVTNFLTNHCNRRFHVGLFDMENIKGSRYGSIDADEFLTMDWNHETIDDIAQTMIQTTVVVMRWIT